MSQVFRSNLSTAELDKRVRLQDSLMTTSQKARAKALRERTRARLMAEKATQAYLERIEQEPVLDKATAERRFFSTPSREGQRKQMLLNREESRTRGDLRILPFAGAIEALAEAKRLDDWGREVSRIAEERRIEIAREAEVLHLQEEFALLIEETPGDVLRAALELGDVDLSASLTWEGLNELQDAIEVALEL